MKNLRSILSQPLKWKFEKNKIILISNDEIVLELKEEKTARASFKLDDKDYIIRHEGFWNPKTVIEKRRQAAADL